MSHLPIKTLSGADTFTNFAVQKQVVNFGSPYTIFRAVGSFVVTDVYLHINSVGTGDDLKTVDIQLFVGPSNAPLATLSTVQTLGTTNPALNDLRLKVNRYFRIPLISDNYAATIMTPANVGTYITVKPTGATFTGAFAGTYFTMGYYVGLR